LELLKASGGITSTVEASQVTPKKLELITDVSTTKQNTFTRVSNQTKVPKSAKNEILGALSTNRHPLFSGLNKLSGHFFWDHRGRIPMGYDSPRAPPAAPPAAGGARPDAAHTRPAWARDVWKPNRFNT